MTWLPGGPEALPHRVLAHLFHHRSAPRWAPTGSGTCHALPPLHRAAPPSSTGTSSNAPLLQRALPDCTSQASRPQAMCVPQYGATAGLTWFSAPGGQEGLVSHPPLGQCVLFASLNLNAGRAASQLPLPSFRAHSTCLPCSALCTPPRPPPLSPCHLAWPRRTAPACTPSLPWEAPGPRRLRHTQWPGAHTSPSVCQVLIRPVGWV